MTLMQGVGVYFSGFFFCGYTHRAALVLHCKLPISSSRQVPGYRPKKGKPCREGYRIACDFDVKYSASYRLLPDIDNNYCWLYYQLGERYCPSGYMFMLNQTWECVLLVLKRVHSYIYTMYSSWHIMGGHPTASTSKWLWPRLQAVQYCWDSLSCLLKMNLPFFFGHFTVYPDKSTVLCSFSVFFWVHQQKN